MNLTPKALTNVNKYHILSEFYMQCIDVYQLEILHIDSVVLTSGTCSSTRIKFLWGGRVWSRRGLVSVLHIIYCIFQAVDLD